MLASANVGSCCVKRIVLVQHGRIFGLRLDKKTPVVIQTNPAFLSENIPLGSKILSINGAHVNTGSEAIEILREHNTVQLDIELPPPYVCFG